MQGNRSNDTSPEVALRRQLHRRGLRYRVHLRPESDFRCVADVVFRKARVVVFIDGCYWHGCQVHGRTPRTNSHYWAAKIARNVARDRRNNKELAARGWLVMRIWEHEDPDAAAERIADAVGQRCWRGTAAVS
jgi:DNA mismatch endonuclease (patch repair protein)